MSDTTTIQETHSEDTQATIIDYKMVTFSLGGKDYGVDIMSVKEIAKFSNFTYVPNTAPYVRGVFNLRGEIISIIDLRLLFNLPTPQRDETSSESGLILRTDTNLVGVIVDSIDKVVGINSSTIQPPHPIFGDINIKYISGVVEHENRLYIILDANRIFQKEAEKEGVPPVPDATKTFVPVERSVGAEGPSGDQQEDFLIQELAAVKDFYVSDINRIWFSNRVEEWKGARTSAQITEVSEADEFLSTFGSTFRDRLWPDAIMDSFIASLPDTDDAIINAWNPGCGRGYESYSIYVALKERYPEKQIKIWAYDTDLLQISSAPDLVISDANISERYDDFLIEGKNGKTFSTVVKESILFEYSDILNSTGLPKMNAVVIRDLLSFLDTAEQTRVFQTIDESVVPGGILILGNNELPLDATMWEDLQSTELKIFKKR